MVYIDKWKKRKTRIDSTNYSCLSQVFLADIKKKEVLLKYGENTATASMDIHAGEPVL